MMCLKNVPIMRILNCRAEEEEEEEDITEWAETEMLNIFQQKQSLMQLSSA